jgi:hypothetical protein
VIAYLLVSCLIALLGGRPAQPSSTALAIHPANPHYFLWQGRPTVLIGSGEHYGALMNLDFDYRKYFDTLAADGMTLTRVFSGAYVEPEGAFNIARNTLAPSPGRFIAPWARSDQPGYANGGNKFDLRRWDKRVLLLPAESACGLRVRKRRSDRVHAVLSNVRGQAVAPEPDEPPEQHQ